MPLWKKRKRHTEEANRPKTLKELAKDAFSKELNKNPELMRQVAFREMGYKDLIEVTDPTTKAKQDIKARIVSKALERLDTNPEVAERFIDAQLEEIVGTPPTSDGGRDEYYSGSSLSHILEEIETMDEIREKLGGKDSKSIISDIMNSEMLKAFGTALASQFGRAAAQRTYIVQVDGEMREVTESQYKQLEQQGLIKPVAALAQAKGPALTQPTEKPIPEPAPTEQVFDIPEPGPDLPDFLLYNIETIASTIDLPPADYVGQLEYEVDAESDYALFLWGFLNRATVDGTVAFLSQYKDHYQVGIYVRNLITEDGKAWMGEVISLIKQRQAEREINA